MTWSYLSIQFSYSKVTMMFKIKTFAWPVFWIISVTSKNETTPQTYSKSYISELNEKFWKTVTCWLSPISQLDLPLLCNSLQQWGRLSVMTFMFDIYTALNWLSSELQSLYNWQFTATQFILVSILEVHDQSFFFSAEPLLCSSSPDISSVQTHREHCLPQSLCCCMHNFCCGDMAFTVP
jgi:hypothetical protein